MKRITPYGDRPIQYADAYSDKPALASAQRPTPHKTVRRAQHSAPLSASGPPLSWQLSDTGFVICVLIGMMAMSAAGWFGYDIMIPREETPALVSPPVAADRNTSVSGITGPKGAVPDTIDMRFGYCFGRERNNCVVDGDTIWLNGTKIRIADIDTPEISSPQCPSEKALGERAKTRLHGLLNEGAFSLKGIDRDTDRYGRSLYIITRSGQSLGDALVDEGLARYYQGGRQPWC